jgi:AmiR/NasT family two-component response regulator
LPGRCVTAPARSSRNRFPPRPSIPLHEERLETRRRIAHLEERLKLRPLVFAAVTRLAAERHIDEERAYAILRDCAMRRRLPIEQLAAFFLGGSESLREVG